MLLLALTCETEEHRFPFNSIQRESERLELRNAEFRYCRNTNVTQLKEKAAFETWLILSHSSQFILAYEIKAPPSVILLWVP